MLRLLVIPILAILLIPLLYVWLKRRAARIRAELDEEHDVETEAVEIRQKSRRLRSNCSEKERAAVRSMKKYNKIKKEVK